MGTESLWGHPQRTLILLRLLEKVHLMELLGLLYVGASSLSMCSIIDATSTWPGWCFNLRVKWSVKSGFPHLTLAKTAGSTSDRTAWKLASKSTTEAYAELTRVPFTRARPSLGVQLEEPAPQLKGCGSIHGLAVRPINGAAMYYSRTRSSEAVIVPLSGTSQVD